MLNIVVPMAGEGRRFFDAGFRLPKPLIDVLGQPMITRVIDTLRPKGEHRFIFLCREEHLQRYPMQEILEESAPGCAIVSVQTLTEGAACTVLLAADYFNNRSPLLIANSDQLIEVELDIFLDDARQRDLAGSILTFPASDKKWSYAALGDDGYVTSVAEKVVISDQATVGVYYFKHGRDFFQSASEMLRKNIRTNNEFYVCPVYNELIAVNPRVGVYQIAASAMHGLGTPEDLASYLRIFAPKESFVWPPMDNPSLH